MIRMQGSAYEDSEVALLPSSVIFQETGLPLPFPMLQDTQSQPIWSELSQGIFKVLGFG